MLDYNSENITYYERFTASNCIILEPWQFAFYCGKQGDADPYRSYTKGITGRFKLPYNTWEGLYRYYGFCEDYKRYCDENCVIPCEAKRAEALYKTIKSIRRDKPWTPRNP
jgi:hypothetical protein